MYGSTARRPANGQRVSPANNAGIRAAMRCPVQISAGLRIEVGDGLVVSRTLHYYSAPAAIEDFRQIVRQLRESGDVVIRLCLGHSGLNPGCIAVFQRNSITGRCDIFAYKGEGDAAWDTLGALYAVSNPICHVPADVK